MTVRDGYNSLRNSPDPKHRQYYYGNMHRIRLLPQEACGKKKLGHMQQYLGEGVWQAITDYEDHNTITCGMFNFTIPQAILREVGVKPGHQVHVQFHLTDTPNRERYASNAEVFDRASRLAVSIEVLGPTAISMSG